jgi:hypothetical protein
MQFARRSDVVWSIYLVLAVIGVFVVLVVDGHYPYEHTAAIIDGSIERPFRYRILVPYLIEATVRVGRGLGLHLTSTGLGHFLQHDFGIRTAHVELALWSAVWGVLLTWATLGLARKMFSECFAVSPLAAFFMPIVYWPFTRALNQDTFWIYDFAAPLFWMIGVRLVMLRKHLAFLAFCAVGVLDKETIALVAVVQFCVLYREGRLRQALVLFGAAVLVVVLVRAVSMVLQDGGRPFSDDDNLMRNFIERNVVQVFRNPMLRSPAFLISFMAGLVLVLRGIRRRPTILQNVMVTVPIYTALWFRGGYFLEIRVFNELLPFLIMLAYVNALELITERHIEPT